MNIKWVCVIAGAMAILAILPLPSAYYQLLRWVIFVSGATASYRFYESNLQGWALAFGAIALIFNPIFPVYLYQKSLWTGIDLVTGLFFLVSSQKFNKEK